MITLTLIIAVTKAIFNCDLHDVQYPLVLFGCVTYSPNCRHHISFGHETRVSRKPGQIEGLSKYQNKRTGKEVFHLVYFSDL